MIWPQAFKRHNNRIIMLFKRRELLLNSRGGFLRKPKAHIVFHLSLKLKFPHVYETM